MVKNRILFNTLRIILIVLILFSCPVQSTLNLNTPTNEDSVGKKRSGLIWIPILFYTPETKTGGGAGLNYFFRESGSDSASRPSSIMGVFMYTQNKQIISELSTDMYRNDEQIHITGYIGYKKFPDKFYGIGKNTSEKNEEDFTSRDIFFGTTVQRRMRSGLHLGLQYMFADRKMEEVEEDGRLIEREILGSEGVRTSGLGFLLNRDTRDNIFYPTSGSFHKLSTIFYSDYIGSDYDFNSHTIDLRQYYSPFSSHVLAFQGYLHSLSGEPPFQKLALLGGQSLLRGYYEGRYRDKNMIVFQAEHRMSLGRNFGLVGFAGIGDVAREMSGFALKDMKHSFGLGLRYMLNPDEKMNIRFDYAIGKDSSGFYITLFEAF